VPDGSFSDLQLRISDEDTTGSAPDWRCLSRGFREDDPEGREAGHKVGLPVLRELLDQPDWTSFVDKLQDGPLAAVPEWIGGDFSQLTGPNDPLFILHLA
jgi:hypothetical protein